MCVFAAVNRAVSCCGRCNEFRCYGGDCLNLELMGLKKISFNVPLSNYRVNQVVQLTPDKDDSALMFEVHRFVLSLSAETEIFITY